jgi:hypothetical protein
MLAPIALYPDPLIGQVLMASTYPLEIVEASRWLQNSNNAALKGDQLAAALKQQPWDPSVKELVPFPEILRLMDSNIQWTEQLGDVFLTQQEAVMDSVQRLRQQAQAAGSLTSTPQQSVSTQGPDIIIEPENPEVIYVPTYNPMAVYGSWPYPDYPPFDFYPPGNFLGTTLIVFGTGIIVVESLHGFHHFNWGHRRIDIDNRRFRELNSGRLTLSSGVWQHDPDHRRGVPYRDTTTRTRFQSASTPETRRNFRGFAAAAVPKQVNPPPVSAFRPNMVSPPRVSREAASEGHGLTTTRPAANVSPLQHIPAMNSVLLPTTPMFESFSRGPDVRAQSMRGSTSRSTSSTTGTSRGGEESHGGNDKGDISNGGRR